MWPPVFDWLPVFAHCFLNTLLDSRLSYFLAMALSALIFLNDRWSNASASAIFNEHCSITAIHPLSALSMTDILITATWIAAIKIDTLEVCMKRLLLPIAALSILTLAAAPTHQATLAMSTVVTRPKQAKASLMALSWRFAQCRFKQKAVQAAF